MTLPDKIDEWIKEAETRPASALTIMRLVANRMRELNERNEELLAENIALQDGSRVQDYQKRIVHLEYQLEMLKRRLGGDPGLSALESLTEETETANILVYNVRGQVLRLEAGQASGRLGRIRDELAFNGEWPRVLSVSEQDELLLLFTSGRIGTCPVAEVPLSEPGSEWKWAEASLPNEPHAGELLACIMPLSNMPLSDYFLQTSRRGCVKKTMTSLSETILSKNYLGKGTIQKADQAFDALLCQKNDRHAILTYEGRLLGLDVESLPYSAEERIRLTASDYVVASFVLPQEASLLCLTQTGKVVQREASILELAKSPLARGQALISPARLEQGTRFVGAVPVRDGERIAVLDADGNLNLYEARTVAGAGTLEARALALSIGVVPAPAAQANQTTNKS
jgi:DNA gyrase/topoisomerase IV subunit A